MDSLAAQYRFYTTDVSKITDAMRVKAALNGDADSARDILQKCCQRLPDQVKHPVVQLLAELSREGISLKKLQKQKLVKDILRNNDYKKFLENNRSKLGEEFYKYLVTCIGRTIEEYLRPRRPNNTKRRREKWLAIGFNLAWAKNNAKGQSDLQERNADITQSMQLIINDYNNGSLQNGVQRFVAGDSDILPRSIERVIKLSGYVGGGPHITDCRGRLAAFILDVINKLESTVTTNDKEDHRPRKIASCIYIECVKAKKSHLLKVIKDLEADNHLDRHDEEIKWLRKYVKDLASYGAKPRGKGNKGTGVDGLEKVYSQEIHRLPAPDRRRNKPKTQEHLEAEYWLLLETPVIGEAVRLIDAIHSPDECDDVLDQLNALRGRTPTGTEHMWLGLVARFNAAESTAKEKKDEPRTTQL